MLCLGLVQCIHCGFCVECFEGIPCPSTGEIHLRKPRRGPKKKVPAPRLATRQSVERYSERVLSKNLTVGQIKTNSESLNQLELPIGNNRIFKKTEGT